MAKVVGSEIVTQRPNPRLQRARVPSPLSRQPLGGSKVMYGN